MNKARLLLFVILTACLSSVIISSNSNAEPDMEVIINEQKYPFQMYVEPDEIDTTITVKNHSDERRNIRLEVILRYLSPTYDYSNLEFQDEEKWIEPNSEITYQYHSRSLWIGPWRMEASAEKINEVQNENGTWYEFYSNGAFDEISFTVNSEQDVNNRYIAVFTMLGSLIAATALGIQFIANRRHTQVLEEGIRLERHTRWTEAYERHSQQIAEELDKNWSGKDAPFLNRNDLFSNVLIQNGRFILREGREQYSTYANVTKTHLMNGYPTTWQLYLDARDNANELCHKIDDTVISLKEAISWVIISKFPDLPKLADWDHNVERFYALEQLSASLITEFRSHSQNGYVNKSSLQNVRTGIQLSDGNSNTIDVVHLRLHSVDVARGSDNDMGKLKEIVDSLIVAPSDELKTIIESYLAIEGQLDNSEKQKEFRYHIRAIVGDVNAGLPIQGESSCHICKGLSDHIFGGRKLGKNA